MQQVSILNKVSIPRHRFIATLLSIPANLSYLASYQPRLTKQRIKYDLVQSMKKIIINATKRCRAPSLPPSVQRQLGGEQYYMVCTLHTATARAKLPLLLNNLE